MVLDIHDSVDAVRGHDTGTEKEDLNTLRYARFVKPYLQVCVSDGGEMMVGVCESADTVRGGDKEKNQATDNSLLWTYA